MPSDIIANKYKIVREIARSNDVVYEALDINSGRRLAVKELVIPTNLTGQARIERIERFHREARASGKLNHPNIVTVYEHGNDNGRFYIAMEYLDGGTLRDLMQCKGPLSTRESVNIASQVLSALAHAHNHQIIHRDVKPDNMHIIGGGVVKLTDFGIARLTEEASMTGEGQVFGTPSYMSPEQIRGKQVDLRSDLFSLAIVLYEMLAGRKPFTGDSVMSITYAIMEAQPGPLQGVSFSIEQVIMRALNKDPLRRYSSADEMRLELQKVEANPGFAPAGYQTGMGTFGGGQNHGYGAPPYQTPPAPYAPQPPVYGGGNFGGGYTPMPTNPSTPNYNPAAYGQIPSTIYAPPPMQPMAQGGPNAAPMPFVNWGQANPNNPGVPGNMPAPPPFPNHKAQPIFSEATIRNFRVFIAALLLGGVVLGMVLLFQSSYYRQQKMAESNVIFAMIKQGKEKLDAQDWDAARMIFEKAYDTGKATAAAPEARKGIVISYNHLGLRAYELKDYKLAHEYWFHAYEIDPDNPDIVANLNRLSDRIGDKDATLQEWRNSRDGQAGNSNPAAPGKDPSLDARCNEAKQLYADGMKAMERRDFTAARDDFQSVIEKATGTTLAADASKTLTELNNQQTGSSPYLGKPN